MNKANEVLLDLQELEQIESIVKRERIKAILQKEKLILQNEIQLIKKSQSQQENKASNDSKSRAPTVKITSYAWDQSEKFIKIYLSNLNGVQNLESSAISLTSDDQNHSLTIKSLNGKNYIFHVPKLLHLVRSASFKVKTDMILIMLKKDSAETWKYLTEKEKLSKDDKEKLPPTDKDGDPSSSIMTMMKKMYDEGDDEMKRTIAKAWTESRDKVQA